MDIKDTLKGYIYYIYQAIELNIFTKSWKLFGLKV